MTFWFWIVLEKQCFFICLWVTINNIQFSNTNFQCHYKKQYWLIVNCARMDKLQWNLNTNNTNIIFQENVIFLLCVRMWYDYTPIKTWVIGQYACEPGFDMYQCWYDPAGIDGNITQTWDSAQKLTLGILLLSGIISVPVWIMPIMMCGMKFSVFPQTSTVGPLEFWNG